jgi:hypothetical protein
MVDKASDPKTLINLIYENDHAFKYWTGQNLGLRHGLRPDVVTPPVSIEDRTVVDLLCLRPCSTGHILR